MSVSAAWTRVSPRFLPFAEGDDLPLSRLARLSLFQITVGLTAVLLIGTLNRVMIVELGVGAALVSIMVSLPLVLAPFRAVIGFRSDRHRSALGWKRVPYIWIGTLLQFGGLAIMPFALILLSGDTEGPAWVGPAAAALAFLMVGAGMHTVQTAGLALATDLCPQEAHPRVVALLSLMLLLGMVAGAVGFGALLANFSQFRLIQVIQGAAVLVLTLNCIALWKQEPRGAARRFPYPPEVSFLQAWRALKREGGWTRRLVTLGLGSAGFSMQDVLLEPYGGQVLGLSVGATTTLTALFASGGILGFVIAARVLARGADAHRLAASGILAGVVAVSAVLFSAPLESVALFGSGTILIGFGNALFAVGTLVACMGQARPGQAGLVLGIWGSVQATAAGLAMALGGVLRDVVASFADSNALGEALTGPAIGYGAVYLTEIALLFVTLAVIGPLVGTRPIIQATAIQAN
jgi:BCD family chlorophyll transporter-like MFS transporter